jgi:hypothetical protein
LREYDAEMVTNKVQDCIAESWDDDEKQREEIMKKLIEVKDALEKLYLTMMQHKK